MTNWRKIRNLHMTKWWAVSWAALLRESVCIVVLSSVCHEEKSAACPCFTWTRLWSSATGLCAPLISGITNGNRRGWREKFSFMVYRAEYWHLHFYFKKEKKMQAKIMWSLGSKTQINGGSCAAIL